MLLHFLLQQFTSKGANLPGLVSTVNVTMLTMVAHTYTPNLGGRGSKIFSMRLSWESETKLGYVVLLLKKKKKESHLTPMPKYFASVCVVCLCV